MLRRAALAGLLLGLPSLMQQTQAQEATGLDVSGQVAQARHLSLAEVRALPAMTVAVEQSGKAARFTGALLWPIVQAAGPVDAAGPKTFLQHVLMARGRDGYAVAVAIGELDLRFAGKPVLVAYARDGEALPALQLVVPGDAHGGRGVRDLMAIEVR